MIYGGSIVHRVGNHVKLLGEVTSAAGRRRVGESENIDGVLVGYGVRFHTDYIAADVGFLKPVTEGATTATSWWACRSSACRTAGSNQLSLMPASPAQRAIAQPATASMTASPPIALPALSERCLSVSQLLGPSSDARRARRRGSQLRLAGPGEPVTAT